MKRDSQAGPSPGSTREDTGAVISTLTSEVTRVQFTERKSLKSKTT